MRKQPEFNPPPFYRPVEVDLFNPNATFRQNAKDGNRYYVRFEITRELWALFEEPDAGLRLKGHLYRVYDDARDEVKAEAETEKPEPKKNATKPAKGQYGRFWQAMYKHGALNHPDLPLAIASELGEEAFEDRPDVKEALKRVFDVDSLTYISPIDFEQWCGGHNLASLITISRNAAAEVQA